MMYPRNKMLNLRINELLSSSTLFIQWITELLVDRLQAYAVYTKVLGFSREAYVDKTGLFAIGLTYDGATKEWAWLDGTAATFINWAPGYPVKLSGDAATAKPHYVYMRTNGTSASFWENHPWDTPAQGLLCQRPPNN